MPKGNPLTLTLQMSFQVNELRKEVLGNAQSAKSASKHFALVELLTKYPGLAGDNRDLRDAFFQAGFSFVSQQGGKQVQVLYSASDALKRKTRNPEDAKWKKFLNPNHH